LQLKFLATHWRILATHKCVATPGLRNTALGVRENLTGGMQNKKKHSKEAYLTTIF
jgi:hypothetical protein